MKSSLPSTAMLITFLLAFGSMAQVNAEPQPVTHLYLHETKSDNDPRLEYKLKVLTEALDLNIAEYGPYEIHLRDEKLQNKRAIQRVAWGKDENVFFGLTSIAREKQMIPIRIPIRLGVHNYRLLLIHKEDQAKFAKVKSIEQLKALKFGVNSRWVMRKVVEKQGFNLVLSNTYMGLFKMLENRRFDYTMRGPHEVFLELEHFAEEVPSIMIEPTLAIHNVAPFYFFVSPQEPELAKRLEQGLKSLSDSGRLRQLFMEFKGDYVRQANIESRHIIHIPNPLLPEQTPLDNQKLWIWPEGKSSAL